MRKHRKLLCVLVLLLFFFLVVIFLSRTGKECVVSLLNKPLTNWAESIIANQEFKKCNVLFYTISKEKTGVITIHHPSFTLPFISSYTEQLEVGVLYSPDGQPKGVTHSLAYDDFMLVEAGNRWEWRENPQLGDNVMYLEEIVSGWFYYEWHW